MTDQHARAQALDPQRSFIVKAPAGSGKTELLTQRFLKLLACAQKAPEEILAVTFTRKAAAQMRQRILLALKNAQNQLVPEKPHEKITWELAQAVLKKDHDLHWHLQQNPNRLRIMTIDALCAQIVSRMPILSHFGTMPEISDYPKRYYQQAVDMMFTETTMAEHWASALQKLWLHLDNRIEMIVELLIMMLAKRDQWLPHLAVMLHDAKDLKAYLHHALQDIIKSHLLNLHAAFSLSQASQLMEALRYAHHQLAILSDQHFLTEVEQFDELPKTQLAAWQAIAELLTTKQNTWRKAFNQSNGFPSAAECKDKEQKIQRKQQKESIGALVAALSENEALLALLNETKILPDSQLSENQSEILAALSELLPVLVAFLQVVFRQAGQVDFIEVTLRALSSLGDELAPSDIALSLDYQLRHLLIDEYQDTSVTQYRLFEKLVMGWHPEDGKTLFLVGDPMQSIYRFRGAEVSLFMHTQQHGLGNVHFVPLSLTVNFRSDEKLIDWINTAFARIFPQQDEKTFGAVTYSPAQPFQPNSRSQVLEFHAITQENQTQAQQVVNIIIESLAENPNENIAILVRRKKDLTEIIHCLKQTHIPFMAHEVEHLANRMHITDFISLLKATLDWTDAISWYAILRAPWVGLSLADLLVLANNTPHALVWETLQNEVILTSLSQEARIALTRFMPIMRYFLNNRQRTTFSVWLKGLWISLGGPACYQQPHFLADIDKMVEMLENHAAKGKIEAINTLEAKLSELYGNISPTELHTKEVSSIGGIVELMTIHKAKGLEFDTVILPHLEEKTLNQDHGLLLWLERSTATGVDLILAPKRAHAEETDSLYHYMSKQLQKKANFEAARLLYVGATRAKKTLHLVADCKSVADKPFKPQAGCFLEMLWPLLAMKISGCDAMEALNADQHPSLAQAQPTVKTKPLTRLARVWQLPAAIANKIQQNLSQVPQSELNLPDKHDFVARAAGKVFHRILQYWVNNDTTVSFAQLSKSCEVALKRSGLTQAPLAKAKALILKALHNMLEDKTGQWILNPAHSERKAEWRLSVKTDKKIENNIIDYSFVDQNNTRWIVDYKLTHNEQMTPALLEGEIEKYRPQLIKYQRMLAAKDDKVVRCGLYFPLAKIWWEYV